MKSIKESIIGRKGTLTIGNLKSGQIVRMKNGELFMYLDYKDANSIQEVSDQMKKAKKKYSYDFTFGGFFYESKSHTIGFLASGSYTLNLKYKKSVHEWDVQYISEQVFKIGLYTKHQLKEMSQKTNFMEINKEINIEICRTKY